MKEGPEIANSYSVASISKDIGLTDLEYKYYVMFIGLLLYPGLIGDVSGLRTAAVEVLLLPAKV